MHECWVRGGGGGGQSGTGKASPGAPPSPCARTRATVQVPKNTSTKSRKGKHSKGQSSRGVLRGRAAEVAPLPGQANRLGSGIARETGLPFRGVCFHTHVSPSHKGFGWDVERPAMARRGGAAWGAGVRGRRHVFKPAGACLGGQMQALGRRRHLRGFDGGLVLTGLHDRESHDSVCASLGSHQWHTCFPPFSLSQ